MPSERIQRFALVVAMIGSFSAVASAVCDVMQTASHSPKCEHRSVEADDVGPALQARETIPRRRGPFLGVLGNPEEAPGQRGAAILEAIAGSAAADAGLRAGDRITVFNGVEVEEYAQLAELIGELNAGDKVIMTAARDGWEREFTIHLGERSDSPSRDAAGSPGAPRAPRTAPPEISEGTQETLALLIVFGLPALITAAIAGPPREGGPELTHLCIYGLVFFPCGGLSLLAIRIFETVLIALRS